MSSCETKSGVTENMRNLVLMSVCVFIALCPGLSASAQNATASAAVDRPSQRWLPLPQSSNFDTFEQMESLRKLRHRVSPDSPSSPFPNLSDDQLRQLDKAFEAWNDEFGDVPFPNWNSIPKELIDSALADPEQRQQAQRLLEQYARQRKLPASGLDPSLSGRFRKSPRLPPAASKTPPGKLPGSDLTTSPSTSASSGRDSSPGSSSGHEAARTEALQELLKELKAIESSRQTNGAVSSDVGLKSKSESARANDRKSVGSPSRQPAVDQRAANSPSARNTPNGRPASQARTSDVSDAKDLDWNALDAKQLASQDPSARGIDAQKPGDKRSDAKKIGATELSQSKDEGPNPFDIFMPPKSDSDSNTAKIGNPFDDIATELSPAERSGAKQSMNVPETADATASRNRADQQSRPGPEGSSGKSPQESFSPSQQELQLDIKKQIEKYGVGRALRRIVEKTFKEQIDNARASSTKASSVNVARGPAPQVRPAQRVPADKRGTGPSTGAVRGAETSAPPATSVSLPRATWSKAWSSALVDAWKSLATAPLGDNAKSSSSSVSGGQAEGSAWNAGFQWGGRGFEAFASVILIGILCFILLSVRKRRVFTSSARTPESVWAKEVLAEGIRTRADVVRAFHRLVLRATQPVASWWTHRVAATRLSESTPQISTAMLEFSNVYEQARYMPPDVELTAEQLSRVHSALQQCAAYRVSGAST